MAPAFRPGLKETCRCLTSRRVGEFTKYRILIGAMLMIFPNAVPWYIGNILPYAYSYIRCNLQTDDVYEKLVWVFPVFIIVSVIGVTTLDMVQKFLSFRTVLILSLLAYEIGLYLTYFTVKQSAWGMTMSLSTLTGYSHGTQIALAYVFANDWFKAKVGTATSAVSASSGFGAIVCTAIITAFMNPDNLKPDIQYRNFYYFSYKDINDRFPTLFLYLGVFSSVCHGLAFYLLDVVKDNVDLSTRKDDTEIPGTVSNTEQNSCTEYSSLARKETIQKYTLDAEQDGGELQENRCQFSAGHKSHIEESTSNSPSTDEEINLSHIESSPPPQSSAAVGPLQVLRSEVFYYIWMCSLSMTITFVTVSGNYKLFGQRWIQDDNFYAAVGTVSSLGTVVFRLLVGVILDRLGVFNTIASMVATNTVGMAFWYFTPRLDRWLYLAWTTFLIGLQSSTYVTFPVAALTCFGSRHYTTNTGLIYASLAVGSLVTPNLTTFLVKSVGWFWLFIFGSAPCLVAVVLLLARISAIQAAA